MLNSFTLMNRLRCVRTVALALWLAAIATLFQALTAHARASKAPVFSDLPLSGASQASPAATNSAPGPVSAVPSPAPGPSAAASSATVTNLSGYVADDKYKLRPGDKISLQI